MNINVCIMVNFLFRSQGLIHIFLPPPYIEFVIQYTGMQEWGYQGLELKQWGVWIMRISLPETLY